MNLQVSLPYSKSCIYQCKFCCTQTHPMYKGDRLGPKAFAFALNEHLKHYRYDSVIITGENEPLQQMDYILEIVKILPKNIQLELTLKGFHFEKFASKHKDVLKRFNLINISVSDDGVINFVTFYQRQLNIAIACNALDIPVRMTYLLTRQLSPHVIREAIRLDFINQITLKVLQGDTTWIKENASTFISKIILEESKVTKANNRFIVVENNGQEIWIDTSCQVTNNYIIFRPDGNLYHNWEDKDPIGANHVKTLLLQR